MLEVESKLRLSDLAPGSVQSEIRAMSVLADQSGGINLAQGICDTAVPAIVAEGATRAIREGHNIYTRLDGIPRLRKAIAEKVEEWRGVRYDPEREVLVTSGATGGYYAAAMALLNPGDEVILFEPFYGYHLSMLTSMRVKPVVVPLTGDDWALDAEAVRRALTPRTRAMLINTPSNPAGKVFNRSEIGALAAIALERDLFVFTDEMYEHFVYGGVRHLSPAAFAGMRERTIVISGFSKTFSVTGWRVGYLLADAKWTPSIGYFHDLTYVCAPAPMQMGCADGLEQLEPAFYQGIAQQHESKRGLLLEALQAAGMTPHKPDGAYYILAEAGHLPGATAPEKARALLRKTGVAAVAGSAFFLHGRGDNLLRFCFAKRDDDLEEACRRLRQLN